MNKNVYKNSTAKLYFVGYHINMYTNPTTVVGRQLYFKMQDEIFQYMIFS